ncbi:MAG: response regulator, partial [Clostridia bacterium]|nr:response regulator [Clostridia bacterium]
MQGTGGYMMRKKILVVDDQKINRAILRKILESTYEVWEAENGVIALKMIKELGTELSAVVLDLIMPELDGYG